MSESESMVERVARALFEHDDRTDWGACVAEIKKPWLDQARVAIAAMRDLPDSITMPAHHNALMHSKYQPYGTGYAFYRAAIDEALK